MSTSLYQLDDDLVRAFCRHSFGDWGAPWRLKEALHPQLPARPIEEGCRVRGNHLLPGRTGICGKPFGDFVLVQWDHAEEPQRWRVTHIERID